MCHTGNSRLVICIYAMVDFKEDIFEGDTFKIIMMLMVMIIIMMMNTILAIITHRDGWRLLGTLVLLQGSWLLNKISFVLNDKSNFIQGVSE